MGEHSKIEWTDATFNPWRGCTKISPGCINCYADSFSKRNPNLLGIWGDRGRRVVAAETGDAGWGAPGKWNDEAAVDCGRRRVFCASLADVFEDWKGRLHASSGHEIWKDRQNSCWEEDVGEPDYAYYHAPITMDDVRSRLFQLIDATKNLDWLLLTKRPENAMRMVPLAWQNCFPPNVWVGASVEDREHGLPRIKHLRSIPAAVRFLSIEPLIEDLGTLPLEGIHWVIVGGESGRGARPMDPAWVRAIRDQCRAASVPFFFKQWGEWYPFGQARLTAASIPVPNPNHCPEWLRDRDGNPAHLRAGKKAAGRLLDGRTWDEIPIM